MNDFTKEDLLIIYLDMCTYVEQKKILKESHTHKELRLKVQSMIDNYCEHDFQALTSFRDICSKCGEIL
jgi:hypothetical protein